MPDKDRVLKRRAQKVAYAKTGGGDKPKKKKVWTKNAVDAKDAASVSAKQRADHKKSETARKAKIAKAKSNKGKKGYDKYGTRLKNPKAAKATPKPKPGAKSQNVKTEKESKVKSTYVNKKDKPPYGTTPKVEKKKATVAKKKVKVTPRKKVKTVGSVKAKPAKKASVSQINKAKSTAGDKLSKKKIPSVPKLDKGKSLSKSDTRKAKRTARKAERKKTGSKVGNALRAVSYGKGANKSNVVERHNEKAKASKTYKAKFGTRSKAEAKPKAKKSTKKFVTPKLGDTKISYKKGRFNASRK